MNNKITSNDNQEFDYSRADDHYPEFLEAIKSNFGSIVGIGAPLFTTNAENLFDTFLGNLPNEDRQHYSCNACKHFVKHFGGLVTIDDNGKTKSAMWNELTVPELFVNSIEALRKIVEKSKVTGVFLSENRIWGQPVTGVWHHMSVTPPQSMVHTSRLKNAGQIMAEKHEDFKMLISALLEYSVETVEQALTLLKSESLYRSEKCLGVAEWLLELHNKRNSTKNTKHRENMTWLAVAKAPIGFCHVKSSMIGTLLDDIKSGMDFNSVSRRFADKMHPLQYQRPQAAPSSGNVAQAEKIVEKLEIQKSLERRFARFDEIETIWEQKESSNKTETNGVFSHLLTKDKTETPQMNIPTTTMTWEKFNRTVLPFAETIEYQIKSGTDNFSAILTAQYDDAPPILQWDKEDQRNPFSHYVYNGGSTYSNWNLSLGYCKVNGVCYQPSMWYNGDYPNQSKSVYLILDGAKDTRYRNAGNALFPETLKSELREIRSTIEAYSRKATIHGYDEASACGIRLQYGSNWNAVIRVKSGSTITIYKLDRWD